MSIVSYDVRDLIDRWMEAESKGEQFPVPLHDFWNIAGHSKKQDAVLLLESLLTKDSDYLRSTVNNGKRGRPSYTYFVTCDGLKHWALASQTEEGRNIRQYFIEAEKKWKIAKKIDPSLAQKAEYQLLINEGLRLEANKHQSELALLQFRKMVTDLASEPIQQKVLGYSEVKVIEYRDRIIKDDDLINDGGTVTKAELCKRYGLVTRNGKPDYKQLNYMIDGAGLTANPDCWDTSVSIREDKQLKRDAVAILDDYYNSIPRARYIVE